MHLTVYAVVMQVYAYLFAICAGGFQKTWAVQGTVSDGEEAAALPSLGRKRV